MTWTWTKLSLAFECAEFRPVFGYFSPSSTTEKWSLEQMRGLRSRAAPAGCRRWAPATVMEIQWPVVSLSDRRESLRPSLLLEAGGTGGIQYSVRIESSFQKSREFIWTYLNVVLQLDLVSGESLVTFRGLAERQTPAKESSEETQLEEKIIPKWLWNGSKEGREKQMEVCV